MNGFGRMCFDEQCVIGWWKNGQLNGYAKVIPLNPNFETVEGIYRNNKRLVDGGEFPEKP